MNNLIANVVEAIEHEGTIRIRVYEQEDDVHLVVMDTGKGVPEAKRDVIFEPGYTTKFNEVGIAATGIGLSHVRDIVPVVEGTGHSGIGASGSERDYISYSYSQDEFNKGGRCR